MISVRNNTWEDEITKIEDKSVDLVYTDPPYGMSYKTNIPGSREWNKSEKTSSKFDILKNDKKGCIDWNLFIRECSRILKDDSFLFIHGNLSMICECFHIFKKHGIKYQGTIAWNKKFAIGGNLKSAMKRDWEPIFYFSKGKPVFNAVEVMRNNQMAKRKRISEISDWEFGLKKRERCGHPTQKPVELCKQIILLTTKEGDVIVDLFAGSGTCGKAAKELNRNCILIEADEKYYDLIMRRIK